MRLKGRMASRSSPVLITPDMQRALGEIYGAKAYPDGLASLYLKGKFLELMCAFLSTAADEPVDQSASLSHRDRTALHEVRQAIDDRLLCAPNWRDPCT